MMRRILLAGLLLAVAPLACADGFNYTYLEGGYISVSPQHGGSSLSGVSVDGDYAFDPAWHALAGYSHVSCCGVSDNDLFAGVGWNTSLASHVDLFVEGEFLNQNHSGNGSDTGWGATGGLRAQLAERFELDGFVTHTDVNSNTENTVGARGLFDIDRFWHIYASYANNSDADTFMLGVRYTF